MAQDLDLTDLAQKIAFNFGSDVCSIWLLSDKDVLTLAGATPPFADQIRRASYHVGEGLTGQVARTQKPLVVSSFEELQRQVSWKGKFDWVLYQNGPHRFGALIAVPIRDGGELLGVLKVERSRGSPQFNAGDLRLLEGEADALARSLREHHRSGGGLAAADQIYSGGLVRIEVIGSVNARLIEYLRRNPEDVRKLSPLQFEHLIARLLEEDGWAVEMTLPSRDGGYDMLAVRHTGGIGVQLLVQAKRYRPDRPVGVAAIRELYTVKQRRHATKALLATTSYVSGPAKSEFRDVIPWEIELKEYEDLVSWLGHDRTPPSSSRP